MQYEVVDYTSRYNEFYSVLNVASLKQTLNKVIV